MTFNRTAVQFQQRKNRFMPNEKPFKIARKSCNKVTGKELSTKPMIKKERE